MKASQIAYSTTYLVPISLIFSIPTDFHSSSCVEMTSRPALQNSQSRGRGGARLREPAANQSYHPLPQTRPAVVSTTRKLPRLTSLDSERMTLHTSNVEVTRRYAFQTRIYQCPTVIHRRMSCNGQRILRRTPLQCVLTIASHRLAGNRLVCRTRPRRQGLRRRRHRRFRR